MKPFIVEDQKRVEYNCCCTNTGVFGCGQDEIVDDISNLGMGLSIYFKILKTFIWCFAVISLINIPLIYAYFISNNDYNINGYQDLLYKTSIGNAASSNLLSLIIFFI